MRTIIGDKAMLAEIETFCAENPKCDCMAGGCDQLASYLASKAGARKMSVKAYDGEVVHYVAEKDGVLYDGNGAATKADIAEEWAFDRSADLVIID